MSRTVKCLSVFMSVVMLALCFASLCTPVFAQAEKYDIFTYESYEDSGVYKAVITGVDASASGDIIIPGELNGNQVDAIGAYAFSYISGITSVVLPDTVTVINDYAFSCCSSMESITLSQTLLRIGEYAFYGCAALDSVVIPESVKEINEYAFDHCEILTSVTLPQGITSIANGMFNGCSMLSAVNIPESVEFIGKNAFENTGITRNGENYDNGVLYIGKHLVKADKNMVSGRCRVREDTKSISCYAFLNCKELTSIAMYAGVKRIDALATLGCTALKDIYYTGTMEDRRSINLPEKSGVSVLRWHFGYDPVAGEYDPGDINGDNAVDNKDITRLFQHFSEWEVDVVDYAVDVNGDGEKNNKDITRLFQYLSEWDVEIFSDSVCRDDFGSMGPIVDF